MMRQLAVIAGYQQLIAALRARKAELGISDRDLEFVAGLSGGHISKILARGASKTLGPLSMGRVLRALGVNLVLVEIKSLTENVKKLYIKRDETKVHRFMLPCGSISQITVLNSAERNAARARSLSPLRRQRIARKAARARWSRPARDASLSPEASPSTKAGQADRGDSRDDWRA